MKKKFSFFIFLLAITLVLSACNDSKEDKSDEDAKGSDSAAGVEEMTIKISHVVAENTPKHQGALAMKEYIEKESDGKVKVEIYSNSSLFGDQDEYQNLVADNIQFIIPDLSKFVGNNPQFNMPSLPFLFDNDEQAIEFWDGEKGEMILSSLEKDGVLGLKFWPNGGKHLTNDVRPLVVPEDLKKLKFRTQGGQVLEEIYATLGAGSESIPFGELYTALDQGVVDGQENTFSNIESKKFDEVQKYMTVMNHTRVDYGLFTNTKFWESLNDDTRKIIEAGVDAGTEVARAEALSLNTKALEIIKERGLTEVTELTPEQVNEFREILEPIYDKYRDEIGADVIDAALKVSGK